jgi:hypothetical protein
MSLRTVATSQLRDPDVLAEAARHPVAIFDAKRSTEMVIGPKVQWDANDTLLNTYSLVVANAIVELRGEQPSPVALGPIGFAASWSLPEREWLLSQLAEAYAESVRRGATGPIVDFIAFMSRSTESSAPSRLNAPIEIDDIPAGLATKLTPRLQ